MLLSRHERPNAISSLAGFPRRLLFLSHLVWQVVRISLARDALVLQPMPSMTERMLWGWAFPGVIVGLVAISDSVTSSGASGIGLSSVNGCWVLSYQLWAVMVPAVALVTVVGCFFTYRLVVEMQDINRSAASAATSVAKDRFKLLVGAGEAGLWLNMALAVVAWVLATLAATNYAGS